MNHTTAWDDFPLDRLGAPPLERLADEEPPRPKQHAVHFMPGEPETLDDFGSQAHIIDYVTHSMLSLGPDDLAIKPLLFTGEPGLGKSTLAKVIASELITRADILDLPEPDYIEVFPADVPNVRALDHIMVRVLRNPGSVLFIDEIHDCKEDSHWRKLYLFLNEGRYKFEGASHPISMPSTTVLAATTDDGDLPDPLKRRFVTWRFKVATPPELAEVVRKRPFPIDEDALDLIIDRLGIDGRPWEVLQCYDQAMTYAKGKGETFIRAEDVEQALSNKGVDAYGLGVEEREAIRALLSVPPRKVPGMEDQVYVLSEGNIVGMTGLHKALYAKTVKPKLLKRGLLTIRGGQMLTPRAVEIYGPYYLPKREPVMVHNEVAETF